MHLTVYKFATRIKFKERILGDLKAKITQENGHTFLAKFQLLNVVHRSALFHNDTFQWEKSGAPTSLPRPRYHILNAEATTERSLHSFFPLAIYRTRRSRASH